MPASTVGRSLSASTACLTMLILAQFTPLRAQVGFNQFLFSPKIDGSLSAIAEGPDGAMWFIGYDSADGGHSQIGRMTLAGAVTNFAVPENNQPNSITTGPDGALWFTETNDQIGRITTTGAITEYPLPPNGGFPGPIAAGPDGALWFTDNLPSSDFPIGNIGRITTSGVVSEYLVPSGQEANDIVAGPDRAMWFTEPEGAAVGRITTGGIVAQRLGAQGDMMQSDA